MAPFMAPLQKVTCPERASLARRTPQGNTIPKHTHQGVPLRARLAAINPRVPPLLPHPLHLRGVITYHRINQHAAKGVVEPVLGAGPDAHGLRSPPKAIGRARRVHMVLFSNASGTKQPPFPIRASIGCAVIPICWFIVHLVVENCSHGAQCRYRRVVETVAFPINRVFSRFKGQILFRH